MIKGLLTIVIPTYNSEKFIFDNLEIICNSLKERSERFEIVIIDDGSSDKTSQELIKFYQENQYQNISFVPLRHLKNQGQGRATLSGFQMARGEFVSTLDDDNEYSISDLLKGYDLIKNDLFTDCYIGHFTRKDRSFLRELISNSRPFINKYLLGVRGDIYFTALRVMRFSLADQMRKCNLSKVHIGPLLNENSNSLKNYVCERNKSIRESNYGFISLIKTTLQTIFLSTDKPLNLIVYLSFFIFALSLGIIGYNILRYFLTERFLPGYTSLITVILLGTSIITFSISLLGTYLKSLFKLNMHGSENGKRYFEILETKAKTASFHIRKAG